MPVLEERYCIHCGIAGRIASEQNEPICPGGDVGVTGHSFRDAISAFHVMPISVLRRLHDDGVPLASTELDRRGIEPPELDLEPSPATDETTAVVSNLLVDARTMVALRTAAGDALGLTDGPSFEFITAMLNADAVHTEDDTLSWRVRCTRGALSYIERCLPEIAAKFPALFPRAKPDTHRYSVLVQVRERIYSGADQFEVLRETEIGVTAADPRDAERQVLA